MPTFKATEVFGNPYTKPEIRPDRAPAPGYLDKVNYIIDFWMEPCEAPLLVYLELAREPAGEAVLTWFDFDLFDILRGWLRPVHGIYGRPTKRRGKRPRPKGKLGWLLSRIPRLTEDIGNWIGKQIPGAESNKARKISQGVKFLWIVDGFLQRGFLYWLIADITIDFAYQWATAMNESIWCQATRDGSLYGTGPGGGVSVIFPYQTIAPDVIHWQKGPCVWVGNGAILHGGFWTCISAIKMRGAPIAGCVYQQRLKIVESGKATEVYSGPVTIPPGTTGECVVSAHIKAPATVRVEHRALQGSGAGEEQQFWCFGGNNTNPGD
jgi:hypothetical protein